MENLIIQTGRHHIPLPHIVCVESWDPGKQRADFKTDRPYRSRIILRTRNETHLCEELPEDFVTRYGFRYLVTEQIAINPAIKFRVETYVPNGLQTTKDFKTRLRWRDMDGEWQSRLLETPAEVVAANVLLVEPKRRTRSRMLSRKRVEQVQNARS
jgi:hypothetical protein